MLCTDKTNNIGYTDMTTNQKISQNTSNCYKNYSDKTTKNMQTNDTF